MGKPILCVDFDGVIHSYTSGWKGEAVISDPPVKGALEWLWRATEFWDVQIYSSRSKSDEGRHAMLDWIGRQAARVLGDGHPMAFSGRDDYPIKFAHEKPSAFLTIDDRAICFEGDWSTIDPVELLKFKPWNKRQTGKTGDFPRGAISRSDQGGLKIEIAFDPSLDLVRVDFGTPTAWFALTRDQARALGEMLIKRAE